MRDCLRRPVRKVFGIQEKVAWAVRGDSITKVKTRTESILDTHLEGVCRFKNHSESR